MTKSKFLRMALIPMSTLIIVGVLLMMYVMAVTEDREIIKVDLSSNRDQKVVFETLALIPGQSCEYNVAFASKPAKKYDIQLDFDENIEKTLKDFAYVRIETSSGEVIVDDLLATVFEAEPIALCVDFEEEKNTELNIKYYLPLSVGNEAQGAEALFELNIIASNE